MRRGLLTTLFLLGATTLAQADYVVIIANLSPKDTTPAAGAMGGFQMGGRPMIGGGAGGRPAAGGAVGVPPPAAGAVGMPPGIGGAGGMPPAGGGLANRGGFPAAGSGLPQGGMANRGGFGFIGGAPPPPPADADEAGNLIVAVVEVDGPLGGYRKKFAAGAPIWFKHHLGQGGGRVLLQHKTKDYEVHVLETADGAALASRSIVFKNKYERLLKEKYTADDMIQLARWALEHGLVNDFTKVMDKLAETEKANTAVAAYVKIKADLARPLSAEDLAEKWKSKLLDGYRITQDDKHHYALVHGEDPNGTVKDQLALLEKSFRSYYYWWALHGITLPVPKDRLVAITTDKGDDFSKLRKTLTAAPSVADSFFARRESLSVFAGKRGDRPYNTLEGMANAKYWERGFQREKLIKGEAGKGYPKEMNSAMPDVRNARAWAVVMKAMEHEWDQTNASHEASRQLVFASGLLPAKVHVPEWIQFGMGSFFEAPLQSPWSGTGAPSAYWLPRFRQAKYESSPKDTLLKVITDGYFRGKTPLSDRASAAERDERSIEQRRARAAAWALTYYLAQARLDGLQRYFKELSRMPRDVELDDKVLIAAFARAFDCVDADRKVSQGKLGTLAGQWMQYTKNQTLEAETVHKKIREFYDKMIKQAKPPANGGMPGAPGVNPALPGVRTPGFLVDLFR